MPTGEIYKRALLASGAIPEGDTASAEIQALRADLKARIAAEEELRLSLNEARLLVDHLGAANGVLTEANQDLQRQVKSANAALRAGEEHMRLIFESATDYAIFTLDLEGCVTSWNPGAQHILGFEADDILGKPADIIFTPEDRNEGRPAIEMCGAAENTRARDERWHTRKDGSRFWAAGMMMPLLSPDGELRGFLKILRDQTERYKAEERRKLLLRELDHRVKNTLATVQSVAAQTLRHTDSLTDFREYFDARLMALARSHDMLSRSGWEGAPLRDVIERTLEPYTQDGGAGRVSVNGAPVRLVPNAAVTLNLALHELATNAAKYGALSAPDGHVEVAWTLGRRARDNVPLVDIVWRERGGPPVRPPTRRGFGSRLLERALPREFGGEVTLDFAPEGVECCIRLPLAPPPEENSTP